MRISSSVEFWLFYLDKVLFSNELIGVIVVLYGIKFLLFGLNMKLGGVVGYFEL